MLRNQQYEGRASSNPLDEWGDIAKYGVGAWIDSEYYERVGGTTTGDRIVKGGGSNTTRSNGDGTVRTTAQRTGTAVNSEPQIAGIGIGSLVLLGLAGFAVYKLA